MSDKGGGTPKPQQSKQAESDNNKKPKSDYRAKEKDFSVVSDAMNKAAPAESAASSPSQTTQDDLRAAASPLRSTIAMGEAVVGNILTREKKRSKRSTPADEAKPKPSSISSKAPPRRATIKRHPKSLRRGILIDRDKALALARAYAQSKVASRKKVLRKRRPLNNARMAVSTPASYMPKMLRNPRTPEVLLKSRTKEEYEDGTLSSEVKSNRSSQAASDAKAAPRILIPKNQALRMAKTYASTRLARARGSAVLEMANKDGKRGRMIIKAAGAKTAKVALRSIRSFAEIAGKNISAGAESTMGADGKAAFAPIKSTAAMSGALLRPKSVYKKTYAAARDSFKSNLPSEAKDTFAPASKAAKATATTAKNTTKTVRTVKKGGKAVVKTGKKVASRIKTAKRTKKGAKLAVKGGKRAFKVTLAFVKAMIKIIKSIKIIAIAAKIVVAVAKAVVKAAVVVVKAVAKAAAALAAAISAKVIIAIAVIAVVLGAVLAVISAIASLFTANTDAETLVSYAVQVRSLDFQANFYIEDRIDEFEADEVVFVPPEKDFYLTNLIKFFAIFNFWRDMNWEDGEEYINQLHGYFWDVEFEEYEFYERVYHAADCDCECEGEAYDYELRLRLYVTIISRSITEIGESLGLDPNDIAWLYEIYENNEILDHFPELEEFVLNNKNTPNATPSFYAATTTGGVTLNKTRAYSYLSNQVALANPITTAT